MLVYAGVLLLCLAGAPALATEEPQYELIRTYPEFELRRYEPHLVAEMQVSGDFDGVGSTAFRVLADYIFGNNRKRESIEMTAPVSQRPSDGEEGEEIGMTAPVKQQPASEGESYVVSFVMPARYTLDTLPEPLDERIRIREEPGQLVAARRYSGRWTHANYQDNLETLREGLARADLRPVWAPVYARYNSPFSLWFLRRNEVLIEVEAPESIELR
jgi:hypothetical protein